MASRNNDVVEGARLEIHFRRACFIKDGNFELLDQWNTVEVIWQGDRAAHIVNGRTVNVATRLQQPDPQNPGQFIPLTRGKIAIEIEYAEIWFRRIEVKAI